MPLEEVLPDIESSLSYLALWLFLCYYKLDILDYSG